MILFITNFINRLYKSILQIWWPFLSVMTILGTLGLWSCFQLFIYPDEVFVIFDGWWIINTYTLTFQIIIVIIGFIWISFLQYYILLHKKTNFIYLIVIGAIAALLSLNISNNFLCFGLSLEASTWALFYFLFFIQTPATGNAAQQYFVIGLISSGLLFLSNVLIFWQCGSLDYTIVANFIHTNTSSFIINFTFLLFFLSFFIKIAVFPFHVWFLNVCERGTRFSLVFLLVFVKLVLFVVFYRIAFFILFPILNSFTTMFQTLMVTSLLIGPIVAFNQSYLPRFLGATGIPQMGFLFFFILGLSIPGIFEKQLAYLLIYSFSMLIILSFILFYEYQKNIIIGKFFWFSFIIAIFSLAGIPPLAGFFTKAYILISAFELNFWIYGVSCIVASVISSVYYIRLVKKLIYDSKISFLKPPAKNFYFLDLLLKFNILTAAPILIILILWIRFECNILTFLTFITKNF